MSTITNNGLFVSKTFQQEPIDECVSKYRKVFMHSSHRKEERSIKACKGDTR